MTPIVGLVGANRSGKSTVADTLASEFGLANLSMGKLLIDQVVANFDPASPAATVGRNALVSFDLDAELVKAAGLEFEYRAAMVELTDLHRAFAALSAAVDRCTTRGRGAVISDVRAHREGLLVAARPDGTLWQVVRPGAYDYALGEAGLLNRIKHRGPRPIANDSTIDDLRARAVSTFRELYSL